MGEAREQTHLVEALQVTSQQQQAPTEMVRAKTFQVSQSVTNRIFMCDSYLATYSNFAFEVNMTINQGDCGGLLLRDDSDHSNLYLFQVCQDGRYNFSTYVNHNSTGELASGDPSAIKQGLNQSNVIAVVALGSNFDMYVNGQKIDSVTDDTYSGGYVGLEVTALNNETMVTYQNARLWTIQ